MWLRLILREIVHRKVNAGLSVVGVTAAVALFVAFLTSANASKRETTRITRNLGFNLRIIPKATNMERFWALGYSDLTMPEAWVQRLAQYERVFITFNHLVATLQQWYPVADREVLLTGLAAAITAPEQRQRPMGYQVKPGTVVVGFEVARAFNLKPGGTFTLAQRPYQVTRCLAETGTEEDMRVYTALPDAQAILGRAGLINEIQAIDCLCLTADQDPLKVIRAELDRALPDTKAIQLRTIADARARQRQTVDRYFAVMSPLILVLGGAWLAVLAVLNVQERRTEIGLLRALGHSPGRIGGLFLGKAVLVGLAGGALGWAAGTTLALEFGPRIFQITAPAIVAEPRWLFYACVAAPAFAALASFLPAMRAVSLDPAVVLRDN
ncbi:MAG: FtsX-like permease family protein [Verrucomicrobia bacterium]|nr:FtsX-like permease family protein [Verrucomicrobiota bacterium]